MPGAVLVAGLALSAFVVARSSGVSVLALSQIQADGASLHDVGGTYVAGWISPSFNPFVDGRFRIFTLLASVVYMLSVTAIGATLVGAIRGADRWPRVVRLLAGFLPGYLMVLAPLQILYAGVPYRTSSWLALIVTPAIAVALQRHALTDTAHDLRHDGAYRRRWLGAAAIITGILLVCGLHRLQAGRNFMVPDSLSAFLTAAGQQLSGVFGTHLAQWDQQSDEWIFSAPLMFNSARGQDYLFPMYAAEFVALASFAALVFGVVHSVARRRPVLVASVALGAVLAASPAIYPWRQIALIGGQNPTMWLGLPGRLVGVVAPWVALLLIGRTSSRRVKVAILLATAGLAFTTVSGTAYVAAALGGAAAWQLLRGRAPTTLDTAATRALIFGLGLLALAAPVFVYWQLHRTDTPDALGWVLVAGVILAMAAAALVALTAQRPGGGSWGPSSALRWATAWVFTLGAGFALSNNLVSSFADGQVRSTLASVLPGYDVPVQSRNIVSGTPDAKFPTFTGQECSISGHCVSFGYFLAGYSVVIVLALATWIALAQQRGSGEEAAPRKATWLVVAGAFVCSFALVDFSGADLATAWVLTRFIEIPYYALVAFAALALVGARNRATAVVGTAVIAAWTLIPLATSHVVPQMARNANWLIEVIH
ncbi:MAG TPA: hypothetical protein VFY45_00275 [Baekduia sp.]|nr:hypothetical protein [Baekduia sp.]